VRWVIGPLLTVLVATFLVALALDIAPGDPVAALAGNHPSPAHLAAIRHELGLDQSFLARYWSWLTGVLHGDLGRSISLRSGVGGAISARLPTTAFLVVYAGLLILVFGIGLGIIGGWFRRLSPAIAALTGLAIAIPAFVAAIVLVQVFALNLELFPAIGAGSGFVDRIWHLTLPAIALALAMSAYLAQISRAAIAAERDREHVVAARGRGMSNGMVFRRHVLRNAALPIITVSGVVVAGTISAAVVVESAFGIDGLGSLLVTSVSAKDYPVVQAIALILVLSFVLVTTAIDLLQRLLDPRIRETGRR